MRSIVGIILVVELDVGFLFHSYNIYTDQKAGMWTLDPIDGTKGFIRGEQYAVCLALIIDAEVQLGVIGCPNLLSDVDNPGGGRGAIFVAVKGQGVEEVSPLYLPSIVSF